MKVPLGNGTDVPKLVDALKSGAAEEQLAVARLVSSLSTEEFSQSRILDAGINFLMTFTRVLRCCLGALLRIRDSQILRRRGSSM